MKNNQADPAAYPGSLRGTDNTDGDSKRGIVVFLTLYLLLVAFFILLNATSVINEDKSKEVMNSMHSTFRPLGVDSDIASEFSSDIGSFAQASVTLLEVADLIKRAIPLAEIEEVKPGQLMSITMKSNTLFVDGKAQLRASAEDLLRRTAVAINDPPPGLRYDVQVLLKRDSTLGSAKSGSTLNAARAGALASELQGRGGPEHSILIGLNPALDDVVEMRFEVRQENDSRVTFEDIVEDE